MQKDEIGGRTRISGWIGDGGTGMRVGKEIMNQGIELLFFEYRTE
jgi:hypothetical protein